MKTATDGTKTATDGIKTATDGTKTATDGTKTATDGTKTATDGTKTATDGTKMATDGMKTMTHGMRKAGEPLGKTTACPRIKKLGLCFGHPVVAAVAHLVDRDFEDDSGKDCAEGDADE